MDFTPIIPLGSNKKIPQDLLERAEKLIHSSVALTGGHPIETLNAVREHLRTINSYYSNKIESEGTRPRDIEKAMKKDFSNDKKKRTLQMLSLAHIETQKKVENLVQTEKFSPYKTEFICTIHNYLYSQDGMKVFLKIKGLEENMIPGGLRTHDVDVGDHIAPKVEELPSLMNKFELLYREGLLGSKVNQLIYALASHHRLVYLHPFLDGNGRTSRLALDGALLATGISGYGLWNISRGLARSGDEYKDMLAHADMNRQGDYDGTGALSTRALNDFVSYMLTCAQDQVDYMTKYLKLSSLTQRFTKYVELTQNGMFDLAPLPKNTDKMFKELLLKGEFKKRTEIDEILGVSRRTATEITKELLHRDYIQSDGPKSSIRLKINSHLAEYIFPEL
ncbi:MAG: cell filamentation protein Fic [Sulfurimonas sp.]|nr:MAG: cell filamentation protein Fic [Sulfurimonas sp.]